MNIGKNVFFWTAIQYFALNCGLYESKLMLFICCGYVAVRTIRLCSCFTYKSTEQNNTLSLNQKIKVSIVSKSNELQEHGSGKLPDCALHLLDASLRFLADFSYLAQGLLLELL